MSIEATAQNLATQLSQKCIDLANVSGQLADAQARIAELEAAASEPEPKKK